jgi:hypothetical protein
MYNAYTLTKLSVLCHLNQEIYFSTGIKWGINPPYCRQLPALGKTEPVWCDTD